MTKAVRKEISKGDYKFFIGRVEKIGNGQVEFIADTQKKAVELLGEKIPQNVFDAENNQKAFDMWLGSEINPIIDNDGYKEEIRVFGDSYDFFEVKTENESTEFKYYLKSNRPLFGAVPSGHIHAEKFENAVRVARHGYVFGTVIYAKPLTDKQVMMYDLKPDKNNPKVDSSTAEVVKQVAENTETIYLANTGAYTYKLENGEGLDDYYFKQKLHAAIKNGAKIKIRNGLTLYGWIEFSPMEMSDVEICDANRMTELGDCTDKRIAAIIEYPTNAQEEVEEVIDYLDDYAVSVEAQEAAINATENALDN